MSRAANCRRHIMKRFPNEYPPEDPHLITELAQAFTMAEHEGGIPFGDASYGFADNSVLHIQWQARRDYSARGVRFADRPLYYRQKPVTHS